MSSIPAPADTPVYFPPLEITADGWEESGKFISKIQRVLEDEITTYLMQAVSKAIEIMKTLMSGFYPPASSPGEPPHQRTGRLWDSIDIVDIGRDHVDFQMLIYGVFLDQGTARILPRPFITPALEELKDLFPEAVFERMSEL